jgi:carboxypeptidase C (cathepsin A)
VVGNLRQVLALDEDLEVLVVHGYTDLITPYFASELILRQLPVPLQERARLRTYPGGHMFYFRKASRAALHGDAARFYGAGADPTTPMR